jgi:hypothetical protein
MWPTQALPITHPRPIKNKGVIDKIITKGVICPFQSNSITQLCVSVFLWEFLFVAKVAIIHWEDVEKVVIIPRKTINQK